MGGWYVSPVEAVIWCSVFVAGSILLVAVSEALWFRFVAWRGRRANQATLIAHDDDWSE